MKKLGFLLTLVAALGLLIGLPVKAQAQESIKIGVMAPRTGDWASEGQDMIKVVELLAEQLNAAGGINGAKVEVVVEDDQGMPRTASLAAKKLITAGVVAVVGTYGSSITEASQADYDEAKVLQVATGSTSVRLTEKGLKLFFRTCPRDDEQGRVLAENIKKLGFRKVAIVHDNTSYSKGLADETRALFQQDQEMTEVFYDSITPGDQDYSATLTKIKAASPDVIVFTGYYPEAAMILRQKHDMDWNVAMIGGDATNNLDLVVIAGNQAASGYYFVSPPALKEMTTDSAKKFSVDYETKYKSQPSSVWAVLAGDAFSVIVESIKAVGADSEKMAQWLKTDFKNYEGFSGPISFNQIGDRVGEVYRLYTVNSEGQYIIQ
ncbi:MAG: branched-chain amino acid ABC transporter substrate-binding protein [Deltaproteobacteria bacterium]|jgi:branched-chain amino acid transport system substrate-binding protein|nr:branched-chain amino acid ABC transporter substrate-binding protein [Deltaproteobacteria bacterium]